MLDVLRQHSVQRVSLMPRELREPFHARQSLRESQQSGIEFIAIRRRPLAIPANRSATQGR